MSQKQIFKYFVIGLSVMTAGILVMEIYLRRGVDETAPLSASLPNVEIDFTFLTSEALKEIFPFDVITEPEGAVGRDNPFLPFE